MKMFFETTLGNGNYLSVHPFQTLKNLFYSGINKIFRKNDDYTSWYITKIMKALFLIFKGLKEVDTKVHTIYQSGFGKHIYAVKGCLMTAFSCEDCDMKKVYPLMYLIHAVFCYVLKQAKTTFWVAFFNVNSGIISIVEVKLFHFLSQIFFLVVQTHGFIKFRKKTMKKSYGKKTKFWKPFFFKGLNRTDTKVLAIPQSGF